MRLTIPDDKRVDETWVELVIEDLWDSVKRVRNKSGKREEKHVLHFGTSSVEVTVRRVNP